MMDKSYMTALIPGSFKPCTGAHIEMIDQFTLDPAIEQVIVLVSPGSRDGITQKKAMNILQRMIRPSSKVFIKAAEWPSAIISAQRIISESGPGFYAIGYSGKGYDAIIAKNIVDEFGESERIHVTAMPFEEGDSMLFVGRDDEHEGEPISATVLRNDIINDDFDNFVTGYPNSDPEDILWVWEEIASIVMNESQFGTGPSTVSSSGNYDRSQPGYYYKSTFPIMEEGDNEREDISESSYAEVPYPWEYYNLTFGEINEMIDKVLSGALENMFEKLEGQNVMLTVKEDEIYLARADKQMKNNGELSTKWNDVHDYFGESLPERIKLSYKYAIRDIQRVLEDSELDLKRIFKDGRRWMNIDLLDRRNEESDDYVIFQLKMNSIIEVDDEGLKVKELSNREALDDIKHEMERFQRTKKFDNISFVSEPKKAAIDTKEQDERKEKLLNELKGFMKDNHLDGKNNIADYVSNELETMIKKYTKDEHIISTLIKRWVSGNYYVKMDSFLENKDKALIKEVNRIDDDIDNIIGDLLDPIIVLFSKLGVAVLKNIKDTFSSNPELFSYDTRMEAESAISKIKDYIKDGKTKDPEDFDKKMKYIEKQLSRLEKSGGLDGISSKNSVVFEYKNKIFKLTGVNEPIKNLIDFFKIK